MKQEGTDRQQSSKQNSVRQNKSPYQFRKGIDRVDATTLTPARPSRAWGLNLTHKTLKHLIGFRRSEQHRQPDDGGADRITVRRMPKSSMRTRGITDVNRPTTKPQSMAASSAAAFTRHQNQRNTSTTPGPIRSRSRNTVPMLRSPER